MAVCARCWGATIGLWAAWLLVRRLTTDWEKGRRGEKEKGRNRDVQSQVSPCLLVSLSPCLQIRRSSIVERLVGAYLALPWLLRLFVSGLPFLLWSAEIRWWAAAPYWLLVLNGAQAGCWAGLFFCSIWLRTKSARYEEEKTVFCD
jgi:hypothetical protein